MNRIKSIQFYNHPVLGDLSLNFADENDRSVDTVILAGENGTGKSSILNALFQIASGRIDFEATMVFINESGEHVIDFQKDDDGYIVVKGLRNYNFSIHSAQYDKYTHFRGIYSDVEITFANEPIRSVTDKVLDSAEKSFRSNGKTPKEIKQLLVDVQAIDDSELAAAYRAAHASNADTNRLAVDQRMSRFTSAFSMMFDNLRYEKVVNTDNGKEPLFLKYGKEVPLDQLSSGEQQIIFRGCFLLKDRNALEGPFVFIDEPEISLHPAWQKKILNYYQHIFTNGKGNQISQIFVVTHSPFIIHNEERHDDKVIVLQRDAQGKIVVSEKSEYYRCDSVQVVKDAFNVNWPLNQPIVYLEGRTDERYFNHAINLYEIDTRGVLFKCIGDFDEKTGKETEMGSGALNRAYTVMRRLVPEARQLFLFDCDTKREHESRGNVRTLSMEHFDNPRFHSGIENALIVDKIDSFKEFYQDKSSIGDYGEKRSYQEFQKMKFCKYVCSLNANEGKIVLKNVADMAKKIIAEMTDK